MLSLSAFRGVGVLTGRQSAVAVAAAKTAVGNHLLTQSRDMASKRHKKIIKMAKGYRGRAKSCFSIAVEKVEKGLQYAYAHRKVRDTRLLASLKILLRATVKRGNSHNFGCDYVYVCGWLT